MRHHEPTAWRKHEGTLSLPCPGLHLVTTNVIKRRRSRAVPTQRLPVLRASLIRYSPQPNASDTSGLSVATRPESCSSERKTLLSPHISEQTVVQVDIMIWPKS